MLVTVHYEDGVDVFDTAERIDTASYIGNTLANWSLRLEDAREGDGLGGRRLWLRLYAHDPAAPGDETGPDGLPAACRRDVACFLIADERDVGRLLRVRINGETVLARIGGELANADRLSHIADLAEVIAPQALAARAALERTTGDGADGDREAALCAAMGLSPDAFALLERMMPPED